MQQKAEDTVSKQNLEVVEICAGAGGQSLGLEKAGFAHRAAIEIDRDACDTLELNRPDWEVLRGSVTDPAVFRPSAYEGVDLFAGGVPCPPFSIAGQQLGAQDERDLYAFAVHAVREMRPKAFLLENVRGLSGRRFAGYRAHIQDQLHRWGYWADWRLLQASDFGVPQLRPRFILVALQQDYAPFFTWPDHAPAPPTVGEILFGQMAALGWEGAERWREAANGIAPTVVGGSKKHGGADLGPTRAKAAWRALGVDGLGLADAPPDESFPVAHVPRLTNPMVARVQGWLPEDDWGFSGRKTSTYRQIGNAFPPPVARAVGESLAHALRQEGKGNAELERAEQADATVYRALAAAPGKYVTLQRLTDATGQTAEQIGEAIAHLEADFEIDVRHASGLPRFRLSNFKGLIDPEDCDESELTATRG